MRVRSAFDMHTGHPSNEVRLNLANQLYMSPKSVQVWFQNRRQKLRGQQQQSIDNQPANNDSTIVAHLAVGNVGKAVRMQIANASAAASMHPAQGYALPRPDEFQTTLPAHIMSELASVSAAEQDLAHFTRQLTQRKVELLDTIRHLQQQTPPPRTMAETVKY